MYIPDTTNFLGGSIGTGVPFPTVKNRKITVKIKAKPLSKSKSPTTCNNELVNCGKWKVLFKLIAIRGKTTKPHGRTIKAASAEVGFMM